MATKSVHIAFITHRELQGYYVGSLKITPNARPFPFIKICLAISVPALNLDNFSCNFNDDLQTIFRTWITFMFVLWPFFNDMLSFMDNANVDYPRVNRSCLPSTANRTSTVCVENSPRLWLAILKRLSIILRGSTIWGLCHWTVV